MRYTRLWLKHTAVVGIYFRDTTIEDDELYTACHWSGYLELSSKLAEALREAIEMDMSDAKEIEVPPLPLRPHVTCRNVGCTYRPDYIIFTVIQVV